MERILIQYEVTSRQDGRDLVNGFWQAGLDTCKLLHGMLREKVIPENSYFQLWSDATLTWSADAVDMPEVLDEDFNTVLWCDGMTFDPRCLSKINKTN